MDIKNTNNEIEFDISYSENGNCPITNLRELQNDLENSLNEDFHKLPIFFSTKEICNKVKRGFLFRFKDWNKSDSVEIKII